MTRRAHISRDGIDFALLSRVEVFCLIDTRAAHDDKKRDTSLFFFVCKKDERLNTKKKKEN